MTKEELLKEAIRRYPKGCKTNPITRNGLSNIIYEQNSNTPYLYKDPDNNWWVIGDGNLYCPYNKLWAKVVEYPEGYIKQIDNFPIY